MAPLDDVHHEHLPDVARQIVARLVREAQAATAGKNQGGHPGAGGMRLGRDEIDALRRRLQSVNITTESSYYRLAVEEGNKESWKEGWKQGWNEGWKQGVERGKIEEAQRLILRQGKIRFGPPDAEDRATIEAIEVLDRLERLSERLLAVANWAELLAETHPGEGSPP